MVVAGKRKSWTFALWCMIPIVDSEWECLTVYVLPGFRTCTMDDWYGASYWQMASKIRTQPVEQLNIHYGAWQPLTHDIHNPRYSFVNWFKRVTSSGQIDNRIRHIIEEKVKNDDSVSGQRIHTLKLHPGCVKRTSRYPPAFPCPLCGRYWRTVQKIGARPEDIMHGDPMNLKFYVALCSHRTIQELLHLLLTGTQHSPQSLWKKCLFY